MSEQPLRNGGSEELSREERMLLSALRQPGKRSVRAETTGAGVRELAVEEVHPLRGDLPAALGLLRRLLAEAPYQDVTLALRDGCLVSLRRTVRSRFSS